MKALQLEFQISNGYGTKTMPAGSWGDGADAGERDHLYSAADVTRAINEAIDKLLNGRLDATEIVDVKTDFATIQRHNNSGCDLVMEYVTILYR